MRKPWTGHLLPLGGIIFLCVGGCHRAFMARAATTHRMPEYQPAADSPNAFDHYAIAAQSAETADAKQLSEVFFYPGQKKTAEKACGPAIEELKRAESMPCDFKFVPREMIQPAPYQAGWRLIGHVLRWEVDDACQAGNWDAAIDATVAATRFGFDLTGGGPTDASLGLCIADDARQGVAPFLEKMGAGQLQRLADGMIAAVKRKPPVAQAIEHEGENIKLSMERLEQSAQTDHLDDISRDLGPGVKEAVDYLGSLRGNSAKLDEYFEQFQTDGNAQLQYLREAADLAASERKDRPKSTFKERPWKHFLPHFYLAAAPLLPMDDRTVARTRMLVLTAELLKQKKLTGSFPAKLNGFDPALVIDPYDRKPFRYRSDGTDFVLYSVGENCRDDGGDTDDSFSTPDLKLEVKK